MVYSKTCMHLFYYLALSVHLQVLRSLTTGYLRLVKNSGIIAKYNADVL